MKDAIAFARIVIAAMLCSVGPATAQTPQTIERELMDLAIGLLGSYGHPASYTYVPHRDAKERAASAVAITGHVLLEGYLVTRDEKWLVKMRIAADSLLAAADLNGNGTTGWGRYWAKIDGAPSMPGDGSNTSFVMGCTLDRNKAYDDEFYDNARIGHFLLALHEVTGDRRYLDAVRRMIDDTWEFGERTASDDGFYYYKTIGACDRGWHVKNINMLMAVPMGMLAKATGEPKYRQRFEAMLRAETDELRRTTANGVAAPNLGYYAVDTMRRHPTQGTYVARAQTTDLGRAIACNPKTGAGESCTAHLGLEARAVDVAIRTTGRYDLASESDIRLLMSGHEARDGDVCVGVGRASTTLRNGTYCAAYYCAFRRNTADYVRRCHERTVDRKWVTPDVMLGIFWGRADRFP